MNILESPARFEAVIRKSRFVAHAAPVETMADTLTVYESVADLQASHNCWAWRLNGQYRFNDDGEPSGSAGKPILAAIEGRDLENVMIVVTRWFGGVKLGVGGLIRAYGGSAAKCLDAASIAVYRPQKTLRVRVDFAFSGVLHSLADQFGAQKLNETFTDNGLELEIQIDLANSRDFSRALTDATRGSVAIRSV